MYVQTKACVKSKVESICFTDVTDVIACFWYKKKKSEVIRQKQIITLYFSKSNKIIQN